MNSSVQAAGKKQKSLRRGWRQLARDVVALICGLRQAVLIDYSPASAQVLVDLLAEIRCLDLEQGEERS